MVGDIFKKIVIEMGEGKIKVEVVDGMIDLEEQYLDQERN